MEEGRIVKIAGPLVVAENMKGAKMYDVVRVSEQKLIGEIIKLEGELASIQVYEETGGLGPGDPVYLTNKPLSVQLGPGLLESIYDGIQRPLTIIRSKIGDYITRGVDAHPLDPNKKWYFQPKVKVQDVVEEGDIIGVVPETSLVSHKIMVPAGIKGKIVKISEGEFTITDTVAVVSSKDKEIEIKMAHFWPVRTPRPYKKRVSPVLPFITGQRILDTFFPIGKGGTACVPGPFGSGKTVIQHQLAKWSDVDIIVYVGCGERGNEMTDVLTEFPKLQDPRKGEPLMKRTILVANTSNMPVAAREASVYTGITMAEYFRDMGYSVALMADSTSRWAEAMREISGRLEEMPGEEGYPAYLGTKIAEFYERAGNVLCLGKDGRMGSLTVIGSVSPPGGDLADPVVQTTLRVVGAFWSLEDILAYKRHFPAISWLNSYTLYYDNLKDWLSNKIGSDFIKMRTQAMKILREEADLEEMVRLVGIEALSDLDRLTLEVARMLREDFLHQNAFDPIDTYTALEKQYLMLEVIMKFEEKAKEALNLGVELNKIQGLEVIEEIARAKYIEEKDRYKIKEIIERIDKQINSLMPTES